MSFDDTFVYLISWASHAELVYEDSQLHGPVYYRVYNVFVAVWTVMSCSNIVYEYLPATTE